MDWLAEEYDDFGGFLNGFDDDLDLAVNEDELPVDNARWQQYNRKSAAAERREEEARGAFLKIREVTERTGTATTIVAMLTPRCGSPSRACAALICGGYSPFPNHFCARLGQPRPGSGWTGRIGIEQTMSECLFDAPKCWRTGFL